jgi:pimeloyl-ACP methyl ester carboxylesterase
VGASITRRLPNSCVQCRAASRRAHDAQNPIRPVMSFSVFVQNTQLCRRKFLNRREVRLSMSTFVLIHGSWHDGSAWDLVIKRLEYYGHHAFGPTVAGHGNGVDKQVTHAQSTQSIVDFIVSNNLTDIVLVGHSYGGTIISKTVEAIPDRVRRLVFWNAIVLNSGERIFDVIPPETS